MYHDGVGCKVSSCDCKKKGKEFRGEGNAPWDALYSPPSFRSISKVTDWLVRFNIVLIILAVISSAEAIYVTFSTTYNQELLDNAFGVIDIVTGIVSILEFLFTLFWYFRATKNIHSFGAKSVTSPIMAVIWWFIPIFFFWKPYNVAQQIWKASNPDVELTEGIEWIKNPSSMIIKQWWISYIISIAGALLLGFVLTGFGTEYNMQPERVGQTTLLTLGLILFQAIQIISIILFIRIIRQISTWQYRKSINV